jgi:DNA-binding NarL/FixJ family response regulator
MMSVDIKRPRLVVVDDHQLFRAGVRAELHKHCEVVGEAADATEAAEVITASAPDDVLLDVHLPNGGGVAVLAALASRKDAPRVLALSVSDAAEDVVPVIRAGTMG